MALRRSDRIARLRGPLVLAIACVCVVSGLAPSAFAGDGFDHTGSPTTPLRDAKTWILQGEPIKNGGCRYVYPDSVTEIPADGWEMRSIAIDMPRCRKLMEEGTPTDIAGESGGSSVEEQADAFMAGPHLDAVASTKGAWQQVIWRDLPGLLLTSDMTQINWTYNGATSTSGSTTGGWSWDYATGWTLGAHGHTAIRAQQLLLPRSDDGDVQQHAVLR